MPKTETKTAQPDGRWHVLGPLGAHLIKSTKGDVGTALCGAKGAISAIPGTIPEGRRPPCEACAAKL